MHWKTQNDNDSSTSQIDMYSQCNFFKMIYRIEQADSKMYTDMRRARNSQDIYEREE